MNSGLLSSSLIQSFLSHVNYANWCVFCGKADKNMFGTAGGREAVLIAYFVINIFILFQTNKPSCLLMAAGKAIAY